MKSRDIRNKARQLAKRLIRFESLAIGNVIEFAAGPGFSEVRGNTSKSSCCSVITRWGMERRARACQVALADEIVKLIQEYMEAE